MTGDGSGCSVDGVDGVAGSAMATAVTQCGRCARQWRQGIAGGDGIERGFKGGGIDDDVHQRFDAGREAARGGREHRNKCIGATLGGSTWQVGAGSGTMCVTFGDVAVELASKEMLEHLGDECAVESAYVGVDERGVSDCVDSRVSAVVHQLGVTVRTIGIGKSLPMVDHLREIVEGEPHGVVNEQINKRGKRPRNTSICVSNGEPVRLSDTESSVAESVAHLRMRGDECGETFETVRLSRRHVHDGAQPARQPDMSVALV